MENEIIVPEVGREATPATLLNIAINQGADLDRLEKLMELQTRWEANQARKAYNIAMSNFKANLPTVVKDKTNLQYKSKYASEDALLNTINPELSKHGLSASFDFDQSNGVIKVTCYITHAEGHRESVSLSGAADGSGSKNPLQQIKSTTTYLRKATFEAITGIASSENDADDDGNGATSYISDKQKSTIVDMINHKEIDETPFLKYMGVDDIDKIKEVDFDKAMKALRLAKGKSHASNNT
ncbi:MAG: ERF family protein [Eubacteriales bacterium]|nr:ERF family protein [Eubacteriales bacterium]